VADAGQGQDSRLTRARLERLVADVLRLPGENRPSWGLRVLTVMMEVSGDATRPEPRPSLQPVAVGKALRFIE